MADNAEGICSFFKRGLIGAAVPGTKMLSAVILTVFQRKLGISGMQGEFFKICARVVLFMLPYTEGAKWQPDMLIHWKKVKKWII